MPNVVPASLDGALERAKSALKVGMRVALAVPVIIVNGKSEEYSCRQHKALKKKKRHCFLCSDV
jgi:glutaredoxin